MAVEAFIYGAIILALFAATLFVFYRFGRFLIWPFGLILLGSITTGIGYVALGERLTVAIAVTFGVGLIGTMLCTLDEDWYF